MSLTIGVKQQRGAAVEKIRNQAMAMVMAEGGGGVEEGLTLVHFQLNLSRF